MTNYIKNKFLYVGDKRSRKARKNIIYSLFYKTINIISGLLIVPLTLNYLDEYRYGIWLTISSVVLWFNFFDVGLGNGLRNKLAEALSKKDYLLSRKYISTTYACIAIISICFMILFFGFNSFLDWSKILNSTEISKNELNFLALIVFTSFSLKLVLKLIISILFARQEPAKRDLIEAICKVLNLIIILILLKTTSGNLIYIGIGFSLVPIIVLLLFSLSSFLRDLKHISPKMKFVDFNLFNDLFNLGGKFFVINISAVILYSTDSMIITQLFSPAHVTPYSIANKYFSVVMMIFAIIVAPLWSASTEAYAKGELNWIKNSVKKLLKIWYLVVILLIMMLFLSEKIFQVWIGDSIKIPFGLCLAWAFFVLMQTFNSIFIQVINGSGRIKLQMIIGSSAALLNIPLSILFAKYFELGIVGVICATISTQIISFMFYQIQYRKIISNNLNGIWDK